jgi:hypothetical protein
MELDMDMGRYEHRKGCTFLSLETETTHEIESAYMFQVVEAASGYLY